MEASGQPSDTLSDVLETVKLTGALFFLVDAHTPWVAEAPASADLAPVILPRAQHVVSYHVVSEGNCWCESPGHDSLALEAGDVLVVPHGQAYQLASACGLRSGWSLNDALAHEAGASRSILAERFTYFVGHPPMLYLTRWRMQLAANRLAAGAAPVSAIATEVGYESEAAFCRAFKKVTHATPASWRSRHEDKPTAHVPASSYCLSGMAMSMSVSPSAPRRLARPVVRWIV